MKPMLSTQLNAPSCTCAALSTRWLGPCLLGLLLISNSTAQGATATEAWVRRYDTTVGGSADQTTKVVTDADGNAIVAGYTYRGNTADDMLIIKYSGAGVALWTNLYSGQGNSSEQARALGVDHSGNVFVAVQALASGGNYDYVTVAYSGAGVPLWTNLFNGPANDADVVKALAVDNGGNVFVTGSSRSSGGNDYATIAYSGTGVALWTNFYNGPANSNDVPSAIAVDHSGNVFVTGTSAGGGVRNDYATVGYSSAGVALWTNRYNGPANSDDEASAIAVDGSGNVFVTGRSRDLGNRYDYATVAYSGAGLVLWTNRYSGPGNSDDSANGIAVDASGNVFVNGSSPGANLYFDYATIAYSGAGVPLWTNRFEGPTPFDEISYALAVDRRGDVIVTGYTRDNGKDPLYATIKYSGAGERLWTNFCSAGNFAFAVAADNSGNVFVTGYAYANAHDSVTVAYSAAGVGLWTNRYDGPGNSADVAKAVAVNKNGILFVTGDSPGTVASDYTTVAYSGAGVALWTNRYNGTGPDQASAMAVDNNGNVFVTGSSSGPGSGPDYATVAYSEAGIALWTNRYNGPGDGWDQPYAVAVDKDGNVFVTGFSQGLNTEYDYATIAYSGAGVALWTNRYNYGSVNYYDEAYALAVDNDSGNVYVTGYSWGGTGFSADCLTLAYSRTGATLWQRRYQGPGVDIGRAVAVDHNSGNVYVTGSSIRPYYDDYLTIAYTRTGVPLWTNSYNGTADGPDTANAVAVGNNGTVFVSGVSTGAGSGSDFATIAYSAAGVPLWTNRFNGPANGYDAANAVAVDVDGNVIVSGSSTRSGGNVDYATVAYSGAGVALWTNRFDGPGHRNDSAARLAVGPDGSVYVTGTSDPFFAGAAGLDFATVKYAYVPRLVIQPLAPGFSTVNLNLSGPPNSSWSIERALMVRGPWTSLGPSLIGANGLGTFQDVSPPAQGAFYRAAQP